MSDFPDEEWPEAPGMTGTVVPKKPRGNGAAPDPWQPAEVAGMGSQATRVEAVRAAAEVMAQVQVAQAMPRTMKRAVDGLKQACKQPAFAEKAFYRYPRGRVKDEETGQWRTNYITGSSVYLARELLRLFGNAQSGIAELSRDDGQGRSEMNAWAWDVETNVRQSTTFLVPHARDKTVDGKHVREAFVDLRDIYENNANQGARRLRQMILAILPPWYVEMGEDLCRATIAGIGATDSDGRPVPLEVRLSDAADGFTTRWGIRLEQIEQKLGVPFAKWVEQDLTTLRVLYRSIAKGESSLDEEFPPAAPTPDELAAQAAARQPDAPAAAPPPQAAPAPAAPAPAEPEASGAVPADPPWPAGPPAETPAELVTKSTASRLSRKFQQIKWNGDAYRDQRRVLSCYMAARDTGKPARMVASVAEMTETEAAHAVEVAEALLATVGGDVDALAAKLQTIYDAWAQRQAAKGRGDAG
jgi:hypothetical protein